MTKIVSDRKQQKNVYIKSTLFFTPAALLLLIFFIGPMVLTIFYSFTNISLTGANANQMTFVGFQNFVEIFKDPKLGVILRNTLVFLVLSGIIGQQFLGFFLASLMKGKNAFIKRFAGLSVLFGWITPEIVAAFMLAAMFADNGTINKVLGFFGITPVSWLFNFPMTCVVIANIWKGTAYSMMMFQAALDNIPDEIIDAAKIDGASRFQVLGSITLPMIKETISTTFIIVTLSTLGAFGLIYAMTGGGPAVSTTTLSIFMYQKAFTAYQIGYGMAIALFMLAIGVALSLAYLKVVKSNE